MRKFERTLSSSAAIAEGLLDKIELDEAEILAKRLLDYCEDDSDEVVLEYCDFCGEPTWLCGALTGTREYDEGLHGSIYHVCQKCFIRQQKRLQTAWDAAVLDDFYDMFDMFDEAGGW